jgi:hypothetical protein
MSSGRTGGGAPAHPSPSPAGMGGGLCRDFIKESLVWHMMQLFVSAAKHIELQNRKMKMARKPRNDCWFLTKPPKHWLNQPPRSKLSRYEMNAIISQQDTDN